MVTGANAITVGLSAACNTKLQFPARLQSFCANTAAFISDCIRRKKDLRLSGAAHQPNQIPSTITTPNSQKASTNYRPTTTDYRPATTNYRLTTNDYRLSTLTLALTLTFTSLFAQPIPGSFDSSFGTNAKLQLPMGFPAINPIDILVQVDGKPITCGTASYDARTNIVLQRSLPNGTPDASFDKDGTLLINLPDSFVKFTATTLQRNGQVLLSGYVQSNFTQRLFVLRLNNDGSFDPSFDTDGIGYYTIPGLLEVSAIICDSLNKITLCGKANNRQLYLLQLNENGSRNEDFSFNGLRLLMPPGIDDFFVTGLTIQPANRYFLIAGRRMDVDETYSTTFVARTTESGFPDNSFDGDGYIIDDPAPDLFQYAANILALPNGSMALGGYTLRNNQLNETSFIKCYATNGMPIVSFGLNGQLQIPARQTHFASAGRIVLEPSSGKMVMAGFKTLNFRYAMAAVRINWDGNIDSSFGAQGFALVPAGDNYSLALALQPDPLNQTLVLYGGGFAGPRNAFATARISAQGSPDSTYGTNGVALQTAGVGRGSGLLSSIAIDSTNRIIGTGYYDAGYFKNLFLTRLAPNGALDVSFGNNGTAVLLLSTQAQPKTIRLLPNQSILVGGTRFDFIAGYDVFFARFTPNGQLDSTFGTNGMLWVSLDSFATSSSGLLKMQTLPDGSAMSLIIENTVLPKTLLFHFSPNGVPNTGFAPEGKKGISFAGVPVDFSMMADSTAVIGGNTNGNYVVRRYKWGGNIDSSFNGGLQKEIDFGGEDELVAIGTMPNGQVVVAGNAPLTVNGLGLARMLKDGSFDTKFTGNGFSTPQMNVPGLNLNTMLIEPDGKILLAGTSYSTISFTQQVFISRIQANGSRDNIYGPNGTAYGGNFGEAGILPVQILRQPDNKFIVGGLSFIYNPSTLETPFLIRLNSSPQIFNFTGTGNWSKLDNWDFGLMPPTTTKLKEMQITINPLTECVLDFPVILKNLGKLTVAPGKILRLSGDFFLW